MDVHEKISVMATALLTNNDSEGALQLYQKFIDENISSTIPSIRNSVNCILKEKIEVLEMIQGDCDLNLDETIILNYDLLITRHLASGDKEKAAKAGYDKGCFLIGHKFWAGIDQLQLVFDNFHSNNDPAILKIVYECAEKIYEEIDIKDGYFENAAVQLAELCLTREIEDVSIYRLCDEIADNLNSKDRYDLAQKIYNKLFNHHSISENQKTYVRFCAALCCEEMELYQKAIYGYQYCLITIREDDDLELLGVLNGMGRCYDALKKHSIAITYYSDVVRRWHADENMLNYVADAHQAVARSYVALAKETDNESMSSKFESAGLQEYLFIIHNYNYITELYELVLDAIVKAFEIDNEIIATKQGSYIKEVAIRLLKETPNASSLDVNLIRTFIL